jgi:hypothetical protein
MDGRAWAELLFMNGKETQANVEAASGTSHDLTETVSRRDLASLNGRRRGTKDFLGRVAQSTQSRQPTPKAGVTDPVDVFGATSAAAAMADKPSMRTPTLGLVHPSGTPRKK